MEYQGWQENCFKVLYNQKILIGVNKNNTNQIITEDITSNDSPLQIGKHKDFVYCLLLNKDQDKLWAGDRTSTVVEYNRVSRLKWETKKIYQNLAIGEIYSLCHFGDIVFAGGNKDFNNVRMINTLDQKGIGNAMQTPVKIIESLQICPISTSKVFLTATGTGRDTNTNHYHFSNPNTSDVFYLSKLCEKSVMEKLFTNPIHHQSELKKQLTNYQPNPEESNSKLVYLLKNEIKSLKAQLLVKDKLVNDIEKKMSSLENELQKSRTENEKSTNLNATLEKKLSEINEKYNSLLKDSKKQAIVRKTLLPNTTGSKCQSNNFDSDIGESTANNSQSIIDSGRHLSTTKLDLKKQNQELTNTIEFFRKENYNLYSQNQKLKPGVEVIQYW
jgi:hypothetical protein